MVMGTPHRSSMARIGSISGAWAAEMAAASSSISGLAPFAGASADISTACSWCGIIIWANMTSLMFASSLPIIWPAADPGTLGPLS